MSNDVRYQLQSNEAVKIHVYAGVRLKSLYQSLQYLMVARLKACEDVPMEDRV